jgi:RNA polymerase sigma factor (sigma-70 family)
MNPPDATLVEELRAGDPQALDLVYDRYRARIYGFLFRLSGRAEVAEELVQETFVRLARHALRLRPDTHLQGFLFAVARNLWRSHQRWSWLDGARLLELALGPGPTEASSPQTLAIASQIEDRFQASVQALPAPQREVLLLVVLEHMEPTEIASLLGLKPDAVRQRLARARASLRDALPDLVLDGDAA